MTMTLDERYEYFEDIDTNDTEYFEDIESRCEEILEIIYRTRQMSETSVVDHIILDLIEEIVELL